LAWLFAADPSSYEHSLRRGKFALWAGMFARCQRVRPTFVCCVALAIDMDSHCTLALQETQSGQYSATIGTWYLQSHCT